MRDVKTLPTGDGDVAEQDGDVAVERSFQMETAGRSRRTWRVLVIAERCQS
ncbi:hypothetical protein ACWEOG_15065 [Amycolatopsis japonica]